ncbi:MAG: hypothetical protein AB1656_16845 [Candidatus Omnitrophota bacterium]
MIFGGFRDLYSKDKIGAFYLSLRYFILLLLFLSILCLPYRVNQDCAIFLQCGMNLLEGKKPYIDFVDINPPLIMYLNIVPAGAAQLLHLHIFPVFQILVLGFVSLSASLVSRILRASDAIPRRTVEAIAAMLAASVLYSYLRCDFGQREHLFILAYLPYFCFRFAQSEGRKISPPLCYSLTAAAAIFACVKPHFLLAMAMTEGFFMLRSRKFITAQNLTAAACAGAYALHFLFLPQDVFDSFFHRYIPLTIKGYEAYNVTYANMLSDYLFLGIAFIVIATLTAAYCWRPRYKNAVYALSLFAGASLAMFLQQKKGFHYHLIPALYGAAMLSVGLVEMIAQWLSASAARRRIVSALLLAPAALCLFLAGYWLLRLPGYSWQPISGETRQVLETYSRPGDAVFNAVRLVEPGFSVLTELNRRPVCRYFTLWPPSLIQHLYEKGDPSASVEEERFLKEITEETRKSKPVLVWSDKGNFEYLSQKDFFKNLYGNYRTLFVEHYVFVIPKRN